MENDILTQKIIGAAIEVHRTLGPGLLESIYEEALCHEFDLRGIQPRRARRTLRKKTLDPSVFSVISVANPLIINFGAKMLREG